MASDLPTDQQDAKPPPMTGAQLDAIRRELGMSFNELAAAIGREGPHAGKRLREMVRGSRRITLQTARLVRSLL